MGVIAPGVRITGSVYGKKEYFEGQKAPGSRKRLKDSEKWKAWSHYFFEPLNIFLGHKLSIPQVSLFYYEQIFSSKEKGG